MAGVEISARHGVGRIVRKLARCAGIGKAVTPHTLRHAFIAPRSMLGAAARRPGRCLHADPRTTMRYDPGPRQPGPARDLLVAAYVAGAVR
jgi:site-specific recombinase XerD